MKYTIKIGLAVMAFLISTSALAWNWGNNGWNNNYYGGGNNGWNNNYYGGGYNGWNRNYLDRGTFYDSRTNQRRHNPWQNSCQWKQIEIQPQCAFAPCPAFKEWKYVCDDQTDQTDTGDGTDRPLPTEPVQSCKMDWVWEKVTQVWCYAAPCPSFGGKWVWKRKCETIGTTR